MLQQKITNLAVPCNNCNWWFERSIFKLKIYIQLMVINMEINASHKNEILKSIPLINDMGLKKGRIKWENEKKMFGLFKEWKIESHELKEELRAMHD